MSVKLANAVYIVWGEADALTQDVEDEITEAFNDAEKFLEERLAVHGFRVVEYRDA